jgi:pyrimidine deaminase RibD-like protein
MVVDYLYMLHRHLTGPLLEALADTPASRAQFQNINTVANVQAKLDDRFARMAIEEAKKSTPEDDQPRPTVGAVAVKHGQLLGKDCRTAVMSNGKMNGQHAEFRLSTMLSGADLDGATIYTTLEPCLNRGDPKVSCVDRLISVKVARVVIGALDPDHRGNGLRKLAHSPSIEVSLFPAHLRSDARLLIQDWKEYSEKHRKKLVTNPERDALRERILEKKGKEVIWLNKKSDTHGSGTIVDCDDEVAVLRCGTADPFTYSLSELETSKQFLHGRIQFALVFKDR